MARGKNTRSRRSGEVARIGAARPLPLRLVSRLPVFGAFAADRIAPIPEPPLSRSKRLRKRLYEALRGRRPEPVPPRRQVPFVSPMIRTMRAPLARTASVVQVAREVRRPRTRWERLREAAREVIDDPMAATRWERLMGLGVALAAGGTPKPAPRPSVISRVQRKPRAKRVVAPERGLQAGLRRLRDLLNENAGPGQSRDRRGRGQKP